MECAIDINLERDSIAILELLRPVEKENSILLSNPNLEKEWDYEKIGDLLPNVITAGSDKKVWWICPFGHAYLSSVSSRVRERGCSICSGKTILKGYNDFASRCPNLLVEWDYEKNAVSPDSIAYGSDKKVWWKCDKNHSYPASINNKKAGAKCPFCSGNKILAGFNDLATTHTALLKEWDYQKNDTKPTSVSAGSHKKAWWICEKCGNEWQTPIYNRTAGHGCPKCAKTSHILKAMDTNETNKRKKTQKKSHEYFMSELALKNPSIQLISTYMGSREKIKCKCLICNYEWDTISDNLLRGHGCPKCANKIGWEKRKSKKQLD
jgi:hypothetical protein